MLIRRRPLVQSRNGVSSNLPLSLPVLIVNLFALTVMRFTFSAIRIRKGGQRLDRHRQPSAKKRVTTSRHRETFPPSKVLFSFYEASIVSFRHRTLRLRQPFKMRELAMTVPPMMHCHYTVTCSAQAPGPRHESEFVVGGHGMKNGRHS